MEQCAIEFQSHEDLERSQHNSPLSASESWHRQQFERSQGQTYLMILESLLEKQEVTGTPPGSLLWELILPR